MEGCVVSETELSDSILIHPRQGLTSDAVKKLMRTFDSIEKLGLNFADYLEMKVHKEFKSHS
jgi:hypothetical protein